MVQATTTAANVARHKVMSKKRKPRSPMKNVTMWLLPCLIVLAGIYLSISNKQPSSNTQRTTSTTKTSKPSASWPKENGIYDFKLQGDKFYKSKDFTKAQESYISAWEALSKHQDVSTLGRYQAIIANNVANMVKKTTSPSSALEWYAKAAEADPKHWPTALNYANTLLSLEKYVLAENYFRRVLKLKPFQPSAMTGLAGVLRHHGMSNSDDEALTSAKEMLLTAHELYPKNADVLANLGLQYLASEEHEVAKAAEYLKEAADLGHQGAKVQLEQLLKAAATVTQ